MTTKTTLTTIRLPVDVLEGLRMAAARETLRRRRTVSMGGLLREAAERIVAQSDHGSLQ